MKNRIVNILLSSFLISTLVFAQVAVNFFHKNHDVHKLTSVTKPLKDGAAGVQKHDEHCKVCAIDFFNHAFLPNTISIFEPEIYKEVESSSQSGFNGTVISFSQDRAPPVSFT